MNPKYYTVSNLGTIVVVGMSIFAVNRVSNNIRDGSFSRESITKIIKERSPSVVEREKRYAKYEEINRMNYDELKKNICRKN